ncbi:amidohydrolase family protein [Streptomyces sennicomposti]
MALHRQPGGQARPAFLPAGPGGNGHRAGNPEHVKGTLSRGRLADFTVLSDDLLATAPERIAEVTVTATVVGGRIAHDTGALRVC